MTKEKDLYTFETKKGIVLKLKQVNKTPLSSLIYSAGFGMDKDRLKEIDDKPESELTQSELKQKRSIAEAGIKLFSYCVANGVENNPTEDDLYELEVLGHRLGSERVNRSLWLRWIVLDDDEAGKLIGQIGALSLK